MSQRNSPIELQSESSASIVMSETYAPFFLQAMHDQPSLVFYRIQETLKESSQKGPSLSSIHSLSIQN